MGKPYSQEISRERVIAAVDGRDVAWWLTLFQVSVLQIQGL